VTSVGGTALAISKASGTYGFEGSMGDLRSVLTNNAWTPFPGYFYFGGGGGTSQDFTQPWYQSFAVPYKTSHTLLTGQTTSTAMRTVPDVSMNGDLYTSVLVGFSNGAPYSEAGYGGTSVSSPTFAAVIADAIQAHGHALGFANPALYLRAGLYHDVKDTSATLSAVFDASPTRIRLIKFESDAGLTATRGYDTATGLGSPDLAFLESFGWWGTR
jgi:subtilase family serine protease